MRNVHEMQYAYKYILSTIVTLSIAGVTKKIKITAMVVIKSDGTIDFKVQKKIKMSYFNLKLPSSLLGWIKTGDELFALLIIFCLIHGYSIKVVNGDTCD